MKCIRLFLVAAFALSSAGCIKFSKTLTLNDDGSGVIDITYTLPEETVTQISGMMKLADELADAAGEPPPGDSHGYLELLLNPSENRIKRKVDSYKIDGLVLKKVKVESRDGSRQVELQLTFKRITDLAQTDFFTDQGFTLSRVQGGNYRLERKGTPVSSSPPVDMEDPQIARLLTPVLGGFDATIGVKTPGRILQANTTRRSLRQAVWNFEFNRDAEDFRAFYTKDLIVIFEGAGLSLPAE
ncbi:MAG: hypothetical protein ISS31_01930 [Kiritimatiellae bacterium]|nr:hypothetical protein [Kiritimatiellia bacterium]